MKTLSLRKKNKNQIDPDDIAMEVIEAVGTNAIVANGYNIIIERRGGEFGGKALYLSSAYDWKLGKDEKGAAILIPLKK